MEAYVTFVTLDPHTKRPMAIPPIVPETAEEIKEFQDGAQRALLKKQHRQHHQEHVESSNNNNNNSNNKNNNNPTANRIETLARELLQQSSALLNLPSLANPHDILIDQTAMQNAMIAQPQVQNLHNRIFGGFLMRRAFELAFATVYCFAGARPIFLEVDQVSFSLPVDVGDLLIFNSHILYTDTGRLVDYYNDEYDNKNNNKNSNHCQPPHNDKEQGQPEILLDEKEVVPLVHVEVQANVTVPEEAKAQVSNLFHFTFGIVPEKKMMMKDDDDEKDDNNNNDINENHKQEATEKPAPSIRRVLPSNIEQARRMATRMIANEEQQQLSNQLFIKRQEQEQEQQERTRD